MEAPPELELAFTVLCSSCSSDVDPTAAELVNNMINKMQAAAQVGPRSFSPPSTLHHLRSSHQEDRVLNSQRRPALRKVLLLPQLMGHLKK